MRLLLASLAALVLTTACGAAPDAAVRAEQPFVGPRAGMPGAVAAVRRPSPAPLRQLPRGGRTIFPRHVVVMAYGTARTAALGVLGEAPPDVAAARLLAGAVPFQAPAGRPVLPAFELITTVAQRSPGADGAYSSYVSEQDVQRYLDAARKAKMLLVLDFQPGAADVLAQVQRYERFLREPEVGVALDPEWVLRPGQRPGRQIGSMDAATVNRVSSYLAQLTARERLPQKLFVVHQFQQRMLPDRDAIVERPGLALVFHVDGFGPQQSKRATYDRLAVRDGRGHNGFKLFLDEDTDLMTPAETMALVPRPELVSYQ